MFAILARLGFLFYWIFDNIAILSKIKFLKNYDAKLAGKRAATAWTFALISSLIGIAITYSELYKEAQKLMEQRKITFESDNEDMKQEYKKLRALH